MRIFVVVKWERDIRYKDEEAGAGGGKEGVDVCRTYAHGVLWNEFALKQSAIVLRTAG